jgi:hypothetical protein
MVKVRNNDMDMAAKKANAVEAAKNASLVSKKATATNVNAGPVVTPVIIPIVKVVKVEKSELIDSILNDAIVDNIYSLDSKTKKKFTIRFNNFEKAALHIVAKSENLSMLAVLEKYSLSKVLSIATKQHRLTSETVKELFESKKVK